MRTKRENIIRGTTQGTEIHRQAERRKTIDMMLRTKDEKNRYNILANTDDIYANEDVAREKRQKNVM